MITTKWLLTWHDGKTLSARLQSKHATEAAPVLFSGALERLPERYAELSAATLVALGENLARETGARLVVRRDGEGWPDESDVEAAPRLAATALAQPAA